MAAPKPCASATALFALYADGSAHRHLTPREALQLLLQKACETSSGENNNKSGGVGGGQLPQVSVSRAIVAGEDAVEKWIFTFQRGGGGGGNGDNSPNNNINNSDQKIIPFPITTQLWAGAPSPIATAPELLLPREYRMSNVKNNNSQNNSSNSNSNQWALLRFLPVSTEARFAVVQDAVGAHIAKDRAISYRHRTETIGDPALAEKLNRARFEADQLLLAVNQDKLIKTMTRTQQQQQQTFNAAAPPPSSTSTSKKSPQRHQQQQLVVPAQINILPSDVVDFERLAPGFRYAKSVTLRNTSTTPISFSVERTTGTTTVKADAVSETKLIHNQQQQTKNSHGVDELSSSSQQQQTRFVQVQNLRGNLLGGGGETVVTFIIDARGPRRITDVFMVHVSTHGTDTAQLPVTVRAEIFGGNNHNNDAGFTLSSTVKVLGKTL